MDQTSVREIGEQLLKNGEAFPFFYAEKYYWILLKDTGKIYPTLEKATLAWIRMKFE